ncbi:MAG: sulfotransferase domain-containing protein [Chitinophagales bacterium]|nr:sulfotransferase domain-containing protein [Chitinophagales bacterium]
MFEEKSAQRIYDTLGKDVKLIFIFRNPVSRAYSHFLMSRRKGFETLSFDDAIEKEPERLNTDPEKKFNYSYFTRGYYALQVERFLKLFSRENFLFLVMEDDFVKNRKVTFERIQDFLGVKKAALNLGVKSNEAAAPKSKMVHDITRKKNPLKKIFGKLIPKSLRKSVQNFISKNNEATIQNPKLDPKREKELIEKYFIGDIHRLEKMIDRDLSSWYN